MPQDKRPEEEEDDVDDEAETRKPPEVKPVSKGTSAAVASKAKSAPAASGDDDSDDVDDEAETRKPPPVASDDEDEEEEGEQVARVAEALGLDDDEDEGKKAPAEDEGPQNRAARRREEARARRKKRREGAKEAAVAWARCADEDELPKDRNLRAKELLLRRREQAAGGGRVQSALLPGEMVDDALARSASAFSKWFRGNWNVIQWVIGGAIVVGGGLLFWNYHREKTSGNASGTLAAAVAAERGRVMEEDKRSDEEKELDQTKIFKTPEERSETAFASYKKVIDEHKGTGAAILAELGVAGLQLDKKEYDQALASYASVLATPLAGADPDVKGRAIEGTGLAKEGKGDVEGALKAFKDLEGIDAKGYKELAMYHQARLHLAKGDKEKAKELLKAAREKLMAPGTEGHPFQFLEAVVDETLRKIDPSAVPAKTSLQGPKGSQMSLEELEKLQRKIKEMTEKKAGEQGEDEH